MDFPSTRSESYTVDNHRNPLFTESEGTEWARNGHGMGMKSKIHRWAAGADLQTIAIGLNSVPLIQH